MSSSRCSRRRSRPKSNSSASDRRRSKRTIEKLQSAFDDVAGASLRSNSEIFLKLAREHLGPASANGRRVSHRARKGDRDDARRRFARRSARPSSRCCASKRNAPRAFGSLKSSLESVALGQQALQKETRTLVNALRRPEVRGQWGEMTLRRLAELAGMVEHCDFNEQVMCAPRTATLRPDMIVHMPDGRDLVVDVKTPLDAYLEAVDAPTDELRARGDAPARAGDRRARAAARRQELLEPVREESGLRDPVHSGRSVPVRRARRVAHPAGRRDSTGRDHRHAVEFRRAAESGRLRLAADGAGAERRDDSHARGGSLQAPRRVRQPSHANWAATSATASMRSTAPSARSNDRCCRARASSRSSACARNARSNRSNRSTA